MIVIRKYMHNSLRNYNYLLGCEYTQQAIIVDPFDAQLMLEVAAEHQFDVKMVVNTHEHFDHVQGNLAIQQATGASVYAHANAKVPGQTHFVQPSDIIELGSIRLRALFTPGHTPMHLCLVAENEVPPLLFSGDTLFNACAGNCKNGGNVDDMYHSFVNELAKLPDDTLLYPGHDYMKNNLGFAKTREPENAMIDYWTEQIEAFDAVDMPVMNLGQERQYNPFLRLNQQAIHQHLLTEFPDLVADEQEIFKALRQLRDHW